MHEPNDAPKSMTLTLYLRLATMVFLHYFVWSCWYNTMAVYLGKLEFTGTQIGLAYGTTAIGALVSPFLIGVIADRYVSAQRLLGVLHLLGAGLLWWISQQTTFGVFYPSLIVYTLTYMAGHGLINTITLTHAPNPARWFPIVMAAASAGWIAAANVVNFAKLADNNGMFTLACGVAVAIALYSFTLPNTPPKGDAGPVSAGKLLGLDALKLFKDRSFAVFMVCSFLICVPLSFYFTWTGAFLSEMNVADYASKMTLGQVSEVGFLLLLPILLPILGAKRIMILGMAAWAARFALFAYFHEQPTATWMVLGGILLHGMCYDFIFVMGRMYVDKAAGDSLRASAQGLHAVFTLGAGMFVGSWLSGVVAQNYTNAQGVHDWKSIWLVPALMSAALIPIFLALFREKPAGPPSV
ncbi:MAG: MFS transporter [Verrucomicrobia bacterium]|nr:MFS transporter [Verrucomicrobiota bacterium]